MTLSSILTIAAVSALVILFFSPLAALRAASALEAIATGLRQHGGAMAAAYATYRHIQRMYRRKGVRIEAVAVHDAATEPAA